MSTTERVGAATGGMHDLRDWLERVEAAGDLVRVEGEVDWDQEMSALSYLLSKTPASPAVLFERVRGYPNECQLLWNGLNTNRRTVITLGEPPDRPVLESVQGLRDRLKRVIPPVEVDAATAPVNEHVLLGDDIDLWRFPVPRHWPLDGGRYLGTADAVITRDPDSGLLNVGTYRMMVHDQRHVGLYVSPGKGAELHIARAWQRNEPLPVAAVLGGDPILFLVGAQAFPKNVCEYDYAGGIRGEPIEVVKGTTTDLPIPARAEIVLEGVIRPHAMRNEGPFGEFTGYYARPEAQTPVVDVTAIHFRARPILMNALMSDAPSAYSSIMRSAGIWADLDRLGIPGIKGVYSHPGAVRGIHVISIEQRYAGHASQVLSLAAQCPSGAYFTQWIVVVDEDIDLLRNTWSTPLDPTQNPPEKRPYGSKALINACKEHRYLPVFAKRTRMTRDVYERALARWHELRLPGHPPVVPSFEETAPATYHESQELDPPPGPASVS